MKTALMAFGVIALVAALNGINGVKTPAPTPTPAPTSTPSPLDNLMVSLEAMCKKNNYQYCTTSESPEEVK